MAAVALTYQKSTVQGVALDMDAPDAVDGIEFLNTAGRDLLVVRNTGASPVTMTVQITKSLDGLALPDRVVTIPAAGVVVLGPLSSAYSQDDDYVRATFSEITGVTCAVVRPS